MPPGGSAQGARVVVGVPRERKPSSGPFHSLHDLARFAADAERGIVKKPTVTRSCT
jgi:hypothetical protein